jgi:hypothetical protein
MLVLRVFALWPLYGVALLQLLHFLQCCRIASRCALTSSVPLSRCMPLLTIHACSYVLATGPKRTLGYCCACCSAVGLMAAFCVHLILAIPRPPARYDPYQGTSLMCSRGGRGNLCLAWCSMCYLGLYSGPRTTSHAFFLW